MGIHCCKKRGSGVVPFEQSRIFCAKTLTKDYSIYSQSGVIRPHHEEESICRELK